MIFFGQFGVGNLGNESSFDSVLSWIRTGAPDLEIGSITNEPNLVTALHGVGSVSMFGDRTGPSRLPRTIRSVLGKITDFVRMTLIIKPGDVVVVPGTGIFEQKLAGPIWTMPLSMLQVALAARTRRARLAFVGVGAAVDKRALARWMSRRILSHVAFLTVRDELSRQALVRIGVQVDSCAVYPDVVFGGSIVPEHMDHPVDPGHLRIGVGVITFHDVANPVRAEEIARRYESALVGFCIGLVRAGHHVELLIGDRQDSYVAGRVLASVRQALNGNTGSGGPVGEIVAPRIESYQGLLDRVRSLDVITGSRYHNLIYGLASGLPVMSISYADKSQAVLDAAGLGQYSIALEDATPERLAKLFENLIADLPQARLSAIDYRARAIEASHEHREALINFLSVKSTASV